MRPASPSPDRRPGPGSRADYVHFTPVTLRWMDNDVFGHLNNVHYYSLFDTAVCQFLVANGILTWRGSADIMVIAESGCRYHSEVAFPDPVTIGLRVGRIGDRSVRYELALFRGDSETASAEGFMVHVCVDAVARRPVPIPQQWRAVFETISKGA